MASSTSTSWRTPHSRRTSSHATRRERRSCSSSSWRRRSRKGPRTREGNHWNMHIFSLTCTVGILPVLKDFNFADPHWFSPDSYYLKSSLDPTGIIDVNFKIMFKKSKVYIYKRSVPVPTYSTYICSTGRGLKKIFLCIRITSIVCIIFKYAFWDRTGNLNY